mgnify:CR=1 FL=1
MNNTKHTPGMSTDAPVHAVRAWSANVEDETPLCGADKNDSAVWGKRTIYYAWVTCADCLAAAGLYMPGPAACFSPGRTGRAKSMGG